MSVFSGDPEVLTAESERARAELQSIVDAELAARGFVVQPANMRDEDVPAGDELRYQIALAKNRNSGFIDSLFTDTPAGSLGPDVGALADHADVDALVFVQLYGVTKSSGQIARDVAVSVLTLGHVIYGTSATRVFVTLVHGTTGRVLWWGYEHTDDAAFDGRPLRALVHDVFERMPTLPATMEAAAAPQATNP
jgi:hypothetical protein